MIVLGIDPGIAITGVAVVSEDKKNLTLVHAQVITTAAADPPSQRLFKLYKSLTTLVHTHKPDMAVVENLFFNTNAKTAFIVGQARGVVQLAIEQQNVPIAEYTPLQVKMALTGYGRADKSQIQQMVKSILKLPKILTPDDEADAAAIALTHCFTYKLNNKMQMVK